MNESPFSPRFSCGWWLEGPEVTLCGVTYKYRRGYWWVVVGKKGSPS